MCLARVGVHIADQAPRESSLQDDPAWTEKRRRRRRARTIPATIEHCPPREARGARKQADRGNVSASQGELTLRWVVQRGCHSAVARSGPDPSDRVETIPSEYPAPEVPMGDRTRYYLVFDALKTATAAEVAESAGRLGLRFPD